MAKQYISLQGKFYLAKIINGVPGAMRHIGNVPSFKLKIDADILEHQESTTGKRTTDFTMVQQTKVTFSGEIEEIDKDNLELILSGKNTAIASQTITNASLGTVKVGDEIKLDGYNLTQVSFTDSSPTPKAVEAGKYQLDSKFGTVKFTDVSDLTMPIKATFTTGAVSSTTFANDFDSEFQLFFKGINTANGIDVAVDLWRIKKSPSTEFPLIHDELGKYSIEGNAMTDDSKGLDAALGLYGRVITIPKA